MKNLRLRVGGLVTVTGLLLMATGVATAQAGQTPNGHSTCAPTSKPTHTSTTSAIAPPETTTTTPTETTTTPTETTTTPTEATTTPTEATTTPEVLGTTATTTPTETIAPPEVLGTTAATTIPTTAPVTVLGVQAAVTNPLPVAAAAGQADTSGQLVAGGLALFGASFTLAGGFILRRRHGDV